MAPDQTQQWMMEDDLEVEVFDVILEDITLIGVEPVSEYSTYYFYLLTTTFADGEVIEKIIKVVHVEIGDITYNYLTDWIQIA